MPEPQVAVCLYDLTLWLLKHTNRFPKNWRVTLGDRLDGCVLDLMSQVQRASVRRDKAGILSEMNEELNVLRMLVRIATEVGCLQPRQYEYASQQIEVIGRQVGGWLKQQRSRTR